MIIVIAIVIAMAVTKRSVEAFVMVLTLDMQPHACAANVDDRADVAEEYVKKCSKS